MYMYIYIYITCIRLSKSEWSSLYDMYVCIILYVCVCIYIYIYIYIYMYLYKSEWSLWIECHAFDRMIFTQASSFEYLHTVACTH